MSADVVERAREAVRDYFGEGVMADIRAGRLPDWDDQTVRETVASILERMLPELEGSRQTDQLAPPILTPEMFGYMIGLLRRATPQKRSACGPREPLRDLHIAVAVHLATQAGLRRTSNRNRKVSSHLPPSACSVVAAELIGVGMKGFTEDSVEQISTRFRNRAARGFLPADA